MGSRLPGSSPQSSDDPTAMRAMRLAIHPQALAFTLLLGAISALPPLSIDMALPALSQIGVTFNSSIGAATLTLSFFLAGLSSAQLIFGPVSDRFGRRPTLLFGATLYTLGSFACALAPTLDALLAARFFEGCGAGAGTTMALAIIRDLFEGPKARSRLSYVSVVLSVAPMVAPSLGAIVLVFAPWRFIYVFLGLGGALLVLILSLVLGESLKKPNAEALTPKRLASNYLRVFRTRASVGYIIVNGCNFGCMFAYVAGSSTLMMRVLGLSATAYGYTFACTAFGIMAGAFLNGRLAAFGVAPARPLAIGLVGTLASTTVLTSLCLGGAVGLNLFLPLLVATTFCYGLVAPNAAHGALHPLPNIAGVAGASLGCVQMACGAMASALVARFSDGHSPKSMVVVMSMFSLAAAATYFLSVRPIERRAALRDPV